MVRLAATIAAALLSGCAGSSTAQVPLVRPAQSPPRVATTASRAQFGSLGARLGSARSRHAVSDPLLWATDQLDSTVTAFDLARPGAPAVMTINDGINSPRGVTIDSHGTLYVANAASGSGYVAEYPLGQTSPSAILSGLSEPNDIAINPNGNVYVSNDGTPASIVVYKPGKTKPYDISSVSISRFRGRYSLTRRVTCTWPTTSRVSLS